MRQCVCGIRNTGALRRTLSGHVSWVDERVVSVQMVRPLPVVDMARCICGMRIRAQHLRTLNGHMKGVHYSVVVSVQDGTTLAGERCEMTRCICGIRTRAHLLRTFTGHTGGLSKACRSVQMVRPLPVEAWTGRDPGCGTRTRAHSYARSTGHTGSDHIACSVQSRRFYPCRWEIGTDKVHLWDVNTGEHLRTLHWTYASGVYTVSFSPDGSTLATGSRGWHGVAMEIQQQNLPSTQKALDDADSPLMSKGEHRKSTY